MQTFGTRPTSVWSSPVSFEPAPKSPPFLFSFPSSSSSSSALSTSPHSYAQNIHSLRRNLLIRDLGIEKIVVPKNRRPKFDLDLQIYDLFNVPLVSGQAYVKWHINGSTRAECRGRTSREPIKDHKVAWGYHQHVQGLRLTIGRNNVLQEQTITFEIHQDYSGGKERIQLGTVTLNLAEYASVDKETRRYLMQDSKINSTVKIGIAMHQVGGDHNYQTPPLKGAQVFSGIAGIIGEQRDQDDTRNMSSLNSKNREAGAAQDMYRRTLAASWQLQAGELNADECIEDIFAGGDGWTPPFARARKPKSVIFDSGVRDSDSDSTSQLSASTPTSNIPTIVTEGPGPLPIRKDPKKATDTLSIITRKFSGHHHKKQKELDELEARDDFVSWRLPSSM
ncbi:N-terminal C2 in EEIG1 and EHBP1 proteins-domain-containing protein [Geopyxis carbonaria]|nr:N-terminal C2 in EEIG1 and EHBP1 proteins-domain-containing protein [Geopyxis carbonaria]